MYFFKKLLGVKVGPEGAKSAGSETEGIELMTIEQCHELALAGHPKGIVIFVGDPSRIEQYYQQDDEGVWLKTSTGGAIIVMEDEGVMEYKVRDVGMPVFIQNNGETVIENQGLGYQEIKIGNSGDSDIQVTQINSSKGGIQIIHADKSSSITNVNQSMS